MFTTVEENSEITQTKRFRYGLLLAWVPLIFFIVPTAIGIIRAIAQASSEKATGFAVLAGGVAEVAATFGLLVIVASEVVAIVMLVRTLSRNHLTRTVVALFSVGCSGLLLLVLGLFMWFATGRHLR
jgi:Ca2+/H+ antiporter